MEMHGPIQPGDNCRIAGKLWWGFLFGVLAKVSCSTSPNLMLPKVSCYTVSWKSWVLFDTLRSKLFWFLYLKIVIILLQFSFQIWLYRVLDHVLKEKSVLGHPLERLDQVRLKRKLVADPLWDVGKELDPTFVHQSSLLWHVLKVHGIVEQILFECEEQWSEFDWTLATSLKLRQNYSADTIYISISKMRLLSRRDAKVNTIFYIN